MAQTSKVAVVTGASAGVGRATALAFARDGAAVALLARSAERLDAAVNEITALGGTALALPVDVADPDQLAQAAAHIEEELGPIDVWVNNAMVTVLSRAVEMTADEYRRVTEVSYLGTVYGTLTALHYMRARNRGVIVQVGSALAYRGIPLQSAYCAAKFAVRGFTDSVRVELIYENSPIHLTMVQLAAFNTPQFQWARHRQSAQPQPLPPIFQPELAAKAIVWASKHRRRELYVGFPALKTIVGNKLFPGLADRMAARQGFTGQMDFSVPPPAPADQRDDNLFTPVSGDYGSHGRFDERATDWSLQFWLSIHRGAVTGALLLILVLGLLLWLFID
jgi:NAD(P)-dependent dehydrogenase (short-subunit alcohol dehydrogenase family)